MSRILDSLSARPIIWTSRGAVRKCSIVAVFLSIQVLDLSSLSCATMEATLSENVWARILWLTPEQSSMVSWRMAALITSSSVVMVDTISPTSMGCTI